MATEKKKKENGYQPSADPDFDDFGVWLASRPKPDNAGKTKTDGAKDNVYRRQSKRMIKQRRLDAGGKS